MTQLGPRFLREYYQCVLGYPRGILLTENGNNGCEGFVSGFVDPTAFYREFRRHRVRLALAAIRSIVSRPSRMAALLANYRRTGASAVHTNEPEVAELSSLAVLPDRAGKGIGTRLVERFVAAARDHGARRVVLTTDATGNDAVNRFYQRLGFTCVRTFEARPGRVLNEYAFETAKS
jgi:ribosomal protein S18 acetylase RimI-like enzyme